MKNQQQTSNQKNVVPEHKIPALSPDRERRLQELKEAFYKLYCFTSQEIDAYLERAAVMAEEGLEKLLAQLKDGLLQQNEVLAKTAARDKKSVKKLTVFVKKTAKNVKKAYEKKEQSGAEKLLEDLDAL